MADINYIANSHENAIDHFGKQAGLYVHLKNPGPWERVTQNNQRALETNFNALLKDSKEPVNIAVIRVTDKIPSETEIGESMVLVGAWTGNSELSGVQLAEVTPKYEDVKRMLSRLFVGPDRKNPDTTMNKLVKAISDATGRIFYTDDDKKQKPGAYGNARVFAEIEKACEKPDPKKPGETNAVKTRTGVNFYALAMTRKELQGYILGTSSISAKLPKANQQSVSGKKRLTDYVSSEFLFRAPPSKKK